jgi:AraC family transcriptional regulator
MNDSEKSRAEYTSRINRSLDYIESHLADEIRLDDIASAAAFSPFHFHRIFSAMMGETPDDYLRRVRLESAANLLIKCPTLSVTEIAMRNGFSTPSHFSSSFRKHFSVPPTEWRNSEKSRIKSKNMKAGKCPIADSAFREDGKNLVFTVREVPAIRVAFVRHLYGYNRLIGNAYTKLARWLKDHDLLDGQNRIIGIPLDNPGITDPEKCRYYAAISVPRDFSPSGEIGKLDIEGGLHAVVRFEGRSSQLRDFHIKVYGKLFPGSGYEPTDRPNYSVYLNRPTIESDRFHIFDKYFPVRKL